MREIAEQDTIEESYVYARIAINDIPPQILKQIAEAAFIEGWQEGVNRGINLSDDLSDAQKVYEAEAEERWREHYMQWYAECVNGWAGRLGVEPSALPLFCEPDQVWHCVYNWRGECVNYYYDHVGNLYGDDGTNPPAWQLDKARLLELVCGYEAEAEEALEAAEADEATDDVSYWQGCLDIIHKAKDAAIEVATNLSPAERYVRANPALNALVNGYKDELDG